MAGWSESDDLPTGSGDGHDQDAALAEKIVTKTNDQFSMISCLGLGRDSDVGDLPGSVISLWLHSNTLATEFL